MASELLDVVECKTTADSFTVKEVAQCAAATFDLDDLPPEPMVSGEAYQVAYAAMCDYKGAQYCDISAELGCDG